MKTIKKASSLLCQRALRPRCGGIARRGGKRIGWLISVAVLAALAEVAHADTPNPGSATNSWLMSWSFNDTNYASDAGFGPLSLTNLALYQLDGLTALLLDSTNAAWLTYKIVEDDGTTTNLTLGRGSATVWFSPDWTSASLSGGG